MATKTATTTTLTAREVQTSLARVKDVTVEEENALRMRHGSAVARTATLARKAPANSEAGDELLLMEMQLLKAYRAHIAAKAQTKAKPVAATAKASPSRAKDKIVRALRKKR